MKKVVSFCIFSVLMVMISLGLKAQTPSGLTLSPANLNPIQVNQYDTVYLIPGDCFDLLGLADDEKVSIEWEILKDGTPIPNGQLSRYFNEFKFESYYRIAQFETGNLPVWWGKTYVSDYCDNGNGIGSYPGAKTALIDTMDMFCRENGHFAISLNPGHNNPYEFDYFYARFFKDTANTAHRLIYNVKEDGDYQFVFHLYRRCNGTKWDQIYVGRDERYYVGGHQSILCGLLSSDTLKPAGPTVPLEVSICIGHTYNLNGHIFDHDTTGALVEFYGVSSCGTSIDSIVDLTLHVIDPETPTLDTANSILQVCDEGDVTITAIPQNVGPNGVCIWYDALGNLIDTANTITQHITANTEFYAFTFNPEGECRSLDSLRVFTEVFASPNPTVSADTTEQCEGGSFTVSLDQVYDQFTWFHGTTAVDSITTASFTIDPATAAAAGAYSASVVDTNYHSVYNTMVACSANSDTVVLVVYEHAEVAITEFDGVALTTSNAGTFCMNDVNHTVTAVVTGGTAPYTLTWANTDAAQVTHSISGDTAIATFALTASCDTLTYTDGITAGNDAHNCSINLGSLVSVEFTLEDTDVPHIYMRATDTTAAPAFANCEYLIPDVTALMDSVVDACGTVTTSQSIAANTHIAADTTLWFFATDNCGHKDSVEITINIPVIHVSATDSVFQHVICSGDANGIIDVMVANGVRPYTVTVTLAGTSTAYTQTGGYDADTTFRFEGLIKGEWAVEIVDANGCIAQADTLNVSAPNMLELDTANVNNLKCWKDNTGSFEYILTGGSMPYVVTIDGPVPSNATINDNNAHQVTGLAAGTYTITVIDDHNCKDTAYVTLTEPDSLQITAISVVNNVRCYGENNGNITATVAGGTTDYVYTWKDSNDVVVRTITKADAEDTTGRILYAGTYTLNVTDANNCPCVDRTETITQHDTLEVVSIVTPNAIECPYQGTYDVTATVAGGTANHVFNWNVNGTNYLIASNTSATDTYTYTEAADAVCDTTFNIVFTVTDDSACVATKNADQFRIVDNTVPVISGTIADTVVIGCGRDAATVPSVVATIADLYDLGIDTIADNCTTLATEFVVTFKDDTTDIACVDKAKATILRTYIVTDKCGNYAETSYTITIKDTVAPSFTRPVDVVLYTDSTCSVDITVASTGDVTDEADNCSTGLDATYADVVTASATCANEYTIERTWSLVDECGNAAEDQVQTITVKDTIHPWFIELPKDTVAYCDDENLDMIRDFFTNPANYSFTDNCTAPTLTISLDSIDTLCNNKTTIEYYKFELEDACGLTTTKYANIYTKDTVAPVLTQPWFDVTLYDCAGSDSLYSAWKNGIHVMDHCTDSAWLYSYDSIRTPGCELVYTEVGTWVFTDGCNYADATSTFKIIDLESPYFVVEPEVNVTVECDGHGNLDTLRNWFRRVRVADDCDPNVTLNLYYEDIAGSLHPWDTTTIVDAAGHLAGFLGTGCNGYYKITWEAIDCSGNGSFTDDNPTTTVEFFRITDSRGPVFEVPAPDTVDCANWETELATWLTVAPAGDSCAQTTFAVTNNAADQQFYSGCYNYNRNVYGTKYVTFTATDACGNATSHTSSFTVNDNDAPVVAFTSGTSMPDWEVSYDPSNCTVAAVMPSTVTWLIDTVGSHTDTLAHFLAAHPELGIASITDCSFPIGVLSVRRIAYPTVVTDNGCKKTFRIAYVIKDHCGNKADTLYQNFIIGDTTKPQGNDFSSGNVYVASNCDITTPTYTTVSELNAHGANITDCPADGTLTVSTPVVAESGNLATCDSTVYKTYTITDACGNSSTVTDTIYIKDTIKPVISVNMTSDIVYKDADCVLTTDTAARYAALLDYTTYAAHNWTMTISDCSSFTITRTSQNFTEADCPELTYLTTYTVTDGCNNTNTFVDTMYIKDSVKPVVANYIDTVDINLNDDCTFTVPQSVLDIASYKDLYNFDHGYTVKECRLDSTVLITAAEDATLVGDTSADACVRYVNYYYKVKDLCGNISDGKFTLTVKFTDRTAPAITGTVVNDTTYMTYPDCENTDVVALRWTTLSQAEAHGYSFSDCHLDATTFTWTRATGPEDHDCYAVDTNYYTVADSCGNTSAEFYQVIVLLDTAAPVIVTTALTDKDIDMEEVNCLGATSVDTFFTVQDVIDYNGTFDVNDCNVDASSTVTLTNVDTADVSCHRQVVRSYTVTDNCGNESHNVFTHTIIINDVTAPVLSLTTLPDDTAYMKSYAEGCDFNADPEFTTVAEVTAAYPAFDATDCNLVDAITCVADTFNVATTELPVIVRIERTYTVTDSCTHSSTFTQTIRIFDTIAPVITADSIDAFTHFPMVNDSVLYAQVGNCEPAAPAVFTTVAEVLSYPAAGITAITDCQLMDEVTLDSTYTSAFGCPDTLIRYYHVEDSTGNYTQFVQYIYTQDTTRPELTGALDTLEVYQDSTCSYVADFNALTVYTTIAEMAGAHLTVEDCHSVTITHADGNYITLDSCPVVGTITRTYTITDSCGNAITTDQIILVKDTIAPTLDAAMVDTVMAYSAGACTFTVPDFTDTIDNHIVDECGLTNGGIVSQSLVAGTTITDTTDVTIVFADHCGNKDSVVVVVVVPSALVIDSLSADSVSCHSMTDGSIFVSANGGTATYAAALYQGSSVTPLVSNDNIAADSVHAFTDLAAGDYTITIVDQDGCEATQGIIVHEPDTLIVSLGFVADADTICDNGGSQLVARIDAAGIGTAPYVYSWQFVNLATNDTLDNCFTPTYPVTLTEVNSTPISDLDSGEYLYIVTVTDARGCKDTAMATLIVNPTYEFHDTARVCFGQDFVWNRVPTGSKTILASELPVNDTIYTIYDSLLTVHKCDSVWVLHLIVTNNAFLTIRPVGNYDQMVLDPSTMRDGDIYGNVETGNYNPGQKGYEIFVDKNCMTDCNIKLALKYTLYRIDGNDTIELTQDVDDYFTPNYRTYLDQYSINAQTITTGPVNIPGNYPTIGMGTSAGNHLNYYHLCWLDPEYDCYGTAFSTYQTNSGIGYNYGRANTIGFSQFRLPGQYIIKCELYQMNGGNDWYGEGYCHNDGKVGGDIATWTRVLSVVNIHLTVTGNPLSASTPMVDPMDGVVTANEVGAMPVANVYPNPARDYITVELSGFEGETKVMLTNANGSIVEAIDVDIESESTPIIKVNTSNYAQGVYMVTARSKDFIVTKRVVIIR